MVGLGPGGPADMTLRAYRALEAAEVIVGYRTYLRLVQEVVQGKEFRGSGMTRELERCRLALELARAGRRVALVSSGDPGVYGMAGPLLQLLGEAADVPVEVVPGVTAAQAAAGLLGAPLMHDYAVISLSDLLTPWEEIAVRLELAARGDFCLALYNPRSHRRVTQVEEAREIILRHRSPATPVGVVKNAGRAGQQVYRSDLAHFTGLPLDMVSVVLVGNSRSRWQGDFLVTPRGYAL